MTKVLLALIIFLSGFASTVHAASYSVAPSSSVTVECLSTEPTCKWEGNLSYTPNAQGNTLYKTILYESNGPYLSYQITNEYWINTNSWSSGTTTINDPIKPEKNVYVRVKAYYPLDQLQKISGNKKQLTLNIDGQVCSEGPTSNCVYNGGQAFDIIFVLKDAPATNSEPTSPAATPVPTSPPITIVTSPTATDTAQIDSSSRQTQITTQSLENTSQTNTTNLNDREEPAESATDSSTLAAPTASISEEVPTSDPTPINTSTDDPQPGAEPTATKIITTIYNLPGKLVADIVTFFHRFR